MYGDGGYRACVALTITRQLIETRLALSRVHTSARDTEHTKLLLSNKRKVNIPSVARPDLNIAGKITVT